MDLSLSVTLKTPYASDYIAIIIPYPVPTFTTKWSQEAKTIGKQNAARGAPLLLSVCSLPESDSLSRR
jgi:hypothetical protein